MIEKCLIEHCAPTLASLKAANLFNACCEEEENIDLQISMWNQLMNPKGVKLLALRSRGNRSLVYVYREKTAGTESESSRSCPVSEKIWI